MERRGGGGEVQWMSNSKPSPQQVYMGRGGMGVVTQAEVATQKKEKTCQENKSGGRNTKQNGKPLCRGRKKGGGGVLDVFNFSREPIVGGKKNYGGILQVLLGYEKKEHQQKN